MQLENEHCYYKYVIFFAGSSCPKNVSRTFRQPILISHAFADPSAGAAGNKNPSRFCGLIIPLLCSINPINSMPHSHPPAYFPLVVTDCTSGLNFETFFQMTPQVTLTLSSVKWLHVCEIVCCTSKLFVAKTLHLNIQK